MSKAIKPTPQENLIGKHPLTENFWSDWLQAEDLPETPKRKHRKLLEKSIKKELVIDKISDWLIEHHIQDSRLTYFKKKKAILGKYGYEDYLKKESGALPQNLITQKGNCAEIVLSEYLQSSTGLKLLVFRLRFNPNVDQSMKGDDVLLFNLSNLKERILLGEAKFRKNGSKQVIDQIIGAFKDDKLPLSIPFIAARLRDEGKDSLADEMEELNSEIHKGKTEVVNVGFLMSDIDCYDFIEKNGDSEIKNFIFLSLGMNEVEDIIIEAFNKAYKKLESL